MKKKCIFIDVDGTIYHRHEEYISDPICEKLKEASQKADLYLSTNRITNIFFMTMINSTIDIDKNTFLFHLN